MQTDVKVFSLCVGARNTLLGEEKTLHSAEYSYLNLFSANAIEKKDNFNEFLHANEVHMCACVIDAHMWHSQRLFVPHPPL